MSMSCLCLVYDNLCIDHKTWKWVMLLFLKVRGYFFTFCPTYHCLCNSILIFLLKKLLAIKALALSQYHTTDVCYCIKCDLDQQNI